jgi:hypothetical protein
LDAAVLSERFEQVDRCAFFGKVCKERAASTVAAGTFESCISVKKGKDLCQAVCAKSRFDAF